ncbi:cell division initiation protein [Streptomyces gamaensis]|uniref:Cell division initiation protein n=1 Tax=Streptomyces gamaensis TaxID=1763542 RepID=A0ABW0Z436_9ACTN
MDVQKKLDEIVTVVAGARSMPMSASCVLNRADLLAMLEEVRTALPAQLASARELIGDREQVVAEAREEAERIIDAARAHRGSLISDTEIARSAREEAGRILDQARREAAEVRAEADDYVDAKLANFEVVLTKTIGSVERGREKLLGRADGSAGHDDGEELPEPSADPHTQRQRADAYVDARLGAVAAVLGSTLEAVGRGRQKLEGARPIDELGAHLAAQDGLSGAPTSDADYLAGLAAPQQPAPTAPQQAPEPPQQPGHYRQDESYQAGSYGYQQQPYGQQADPYAMPQEHGLQGTQGGYQPQPGYDPYGWPAPAADGGYGAAGGYAPQQPAAHQTGQQAGQQEAQQPPRQLDETSLFDTSMIDLNTLRRYEQGR